jgi:hypothetical protein
MNGSRASGTQFGMSALIGLVLAVGVGDLALAKERGTQFKVRSVENRNLEHRELAVQSPAQPPAMRYYGGPKSPMWRGSP